jgi:hypothetical protein
MIKKKLIVIALCAIIITVIAASLNTASSTKHTTLGSDSRGDVIKDVYTPNNTLSSKLANITGTSSQKKVKVAVVTGIHPRETLSINASNAVVKDYAKSHNVEIVHYTIIVHENFDYYPLKELQCKIHHHNLFYGHDI